MKRTWLDRCKEAGMTKKLASDLQSCVDSGGSYEITAKECALFLGLAQGLSVANRQLLISNKLAKVQP